jgi:hypothetical protein
MGIIAMNKLMGFAAVAFCILALAPYADGQKKAAPAKRNIAITDATPQQYALLAQYKEMVGTIRSTTSNSIVLRVEYNPPRSVSAADLKHNSAQANQIRQQIAKLQHDQIALQSSRNAAQAQQRLVQLARDQQRLEVQLYRYQVQQAQHAQQQNMKALRAEGNSKTEFIDFDLPLVEKPAIRRLSLGVEYDDKGNVKEPNPAAKGAGGLPGFPAKLDELVNGVPVKVYLSPPKAGAANKPLKKDENGAVIDALPPNRPQVRMIVVLGDPNGAPALGKAAKK